MKQSSKLTEAERAEALAAGVEVPTPDKTRLDLLTQSKRAYAPIPNMFVQNPNQNLRDRSALLASFVRRRDIRGLQMYLLLNAIISSGDKGWYAAKPLEVWARAIGATEFAQGKSANTATSKILGRLAELKLIEKTREGGMVKVTLLRPDGSGKPYTRPSAGNTDKFFNLSNKYWTEGWHRKLSPAATAMLLVALHEKPGFDLVSERAPAWYGISADTVERGFKELKEHGLLRVVPGYRSESQVEGGIVKFNRYWVQEPFDKPDLFDEFLVPPKKTVKKAKPKTKENRNG